MKKPAYILFLILFFTNCKTDKTDFVLINKPEEFSLEVPSWFNDIDDLHPEAVMEKGKLEKGLYMIIIKEDKDDFRRIINNNREFQELRVNLTSYSDFISEIMEKNSSVKSIKTTDKKDINGNNAIIKEFNKDFENHNMYYKIALINSKEHFYQIMFWTIVDKKDNYIDMINKSINSFKTDPDQKPD